MNYYYFLQDQHVYGSFISHTLYVPVQDECLPKTNTVLTHKLNFYTLPTVEYLVGSFFHTKKNVEIILIRK